MSERVCGEGEANLRVSLHIGRVCECPKERHGKGLAVRAKLWDAKPGNTINVLQAVTVHW